MQYATHLIEAGKPTIIEGNGEWETFGRMFAKVADSRGGSITNVKARLLERTEAQNYAFGIWFSERLTIPTDPFIVKNCVFADVITVRDNFWQGDPVCSEKGWSQSLIIDGVEAQNCGDGGFDLKSYREFRRAIVRKCRVGLKDKEPGDRKCSVFQVYDPVPRGAYGAVGIQFMPPSDGSGRARKRSIGALTIGGKIPAGFRPILVDGCHVDLTISKLNAPGIDPAKLVHCDNGGSFTLA